MHDQTSTPEVTLGEAVHAQAHGVAQILDVREPEEWQEGHIPGAIHIPLGELPVRKGELDPAQPVVVVCRSGRRSLDGADTLITAGFTNVKSLAGGMVDWADAGHPVDRS
ncbi:MAG: rhodanese-like domain-containing protein [Thermomicrobiales bacterium]